MSAARDGANLKSAAQVLAACAFAALAALAVYRGSLDNGFTWDDHIHIEAAPFVEDAAHARALLTRDFWTGRLEVEGSERPLVLAVLLADRALWGAQPRGYHLTNMLLHASCAAALAWLAWLLLGSPLAAAAAGGLFALHPVQSEAVCEITFRADLLAALGVILALAFLRLACARRSWAWAAACAAPFALGLLGKENAVVFPALAVLAEALFPTGPGAARARRTAAVLIFAALAAYGAFRMPHGGYAGPPIVIGGSGNAPAAPTQPKTQYDESPQEWKPSMSDPKVRFLTMSAILGDYARLVFWPAGLQADRSAPTEWRWSSRRAWAGWAVLLLILIAAWAARRALPAAALGLGWFLVALAPVSGVVLLPNIIAERYLYLAVAGAALAAAAALDALARRFPWPAPVLLGAAAALLLPAAAAVRARVPVWHDDASLFGRPPVTDSARLRYNRALLAQQAGRFDEAAQEYRRALELNPRSVEALVNLAEVDRSLGRQPERLDLLRRAVAVAPRSSVAYEALGTALEDAGRLTEASEAYRKAEGTDSRRASPRLRYASLLARAGRFEEALKHAEIAVELDAQSVSARYAQGRIAQELGRLDEAAAAFREVVRLDPQNGLGWANLGACLSDPAESLAATRRAAALLPGSSEIQRNLAAELDKRGLLAEAETAYAASVRLDPSSAFVWHGYGVVLQKRGELEQADKAYGRALALEPDRVESLTNLAGLRAGVGAVDSAFQLITRARALRPDDPVVRAAYDDVLRRRAAAEQ
ncbi:MAG: tetratricopeptide repeat protein [Elusimicrobiota bacterium]